MSEWKQTGREGNFIYTLVSQFFMAEIFTQDDSFECEIYDLVNECVAIRTEKNACSLSVAQSWCEQMLSEMILLNICKTYCQD
jgi:hypothetical protein